MNSRVLSSLVVLVPLLAACGAGPTDGSVTDEDIGSTHEAEISGGGGSNAGETVGSLKSKGYTCGYEIDMGGYACSKTGSPNVYKCTGSADSDTCTAILVQHLPVPIQPPPPVRGI
jgi:hypothetical protein